MTKMMNIKQCQPETEMLLLLIGLIMNLAQEAEAKNEVEEVAHTINEENTNFLLLS